MDLAERTRGLLASGDAALLAPVCPARRDGVATDAKWLLAQLRDAAVEDLAVKRNLVFLQWRRGDAAGAAVVAWGQDGRVVSLDVYG